MQLLGLCLMFLTAVTQHQYYVHYIGFLSNFVLILKYFLLLNLSDMRLVTWLIWLLSKNSRAITFVQLAVLS